MSNQESSAAKRRRMLEKLRAKKKAQGASPAPDGAQPKGREAIPKLDRGGLLPLSFGQERLWLLDQLSPGGNAFNMSFPLRLAGELDPEVVLRALRELVARHEALRTTLVTEDGVTRQRIHPPEFVEPRFVDLSTLGDAERDDRLEELRREVLAEGFDLAVGPLYRAVLVRLAPAEHMLLQSVHHIVNDGWSIGILFRELRTLLEAFGKGEPSPLPELPLQYADFAAWQRGRLRGAHLEDGLAYWRDRLAGAAGTLDLPKDRPRPPRSSERGVQIQATVKADLAARLRALAADRRATLFVAMLAAFDVLMHRLSGQDDVLVGSPVAGRHRREVEGIVGFFLDTLILRTRVEGKDTFEEVFAKTRETVLGATAHQDVPFEKLLEELRPERHLSQTPFFQVLFNMANIPDMRFELPGLEATLDEISDQGAKFDFTLYVLEEGDGLAVDLHYDADLFDRARMVHLLEQYVGLLEQVAADPTRRVADYDLAVGVAEGRLPDPTAPLADDWRGTVGQALRARAAEHPERIAVSDTESEIPYADLDRRVDLLARRLRSAGLRRGDVVAIWAHRAAELVEAMVGVLRAGCAFTVLDPTYPTSRLVSYVDKAQARGLVKVPGADDPPPEVLGALTPPASAAGNAPVLDIGADPEPSVDWDADDGDAQIGPADLAYVAFTSGSTGEPKAIHGGQGSLTHFIKAFREIFGLGSDGDRYSMLSALSHDPLHRDVFLPLCLGATIVVPEQERIGQPGYLADWIRDRGVTVANLVPSMLQLLVQSTEDRGPNENRAPIDSLRRVFTVGEVLTRRDVDSLYRLAPRVRCFNLYGATETQRAVSYVAVPLDADPDPESDLGTGGLDHAALPLGRGLDGVQLLVRNGAGHLAGIGELGEIYVRSHHLALGYADEDATRDRFLPNPFVDGPQAGDRLYRTGDLGRYLPNGDVEFAGRVDAQVKIRGFRIELQEIEAALEGHPGIAGTAVAVRGEGGDPFLAAYLVPADGAPAPEPGELRSALSQRLPEYMVPSAFVVLDRLPRTRTGKLDRRALPEPELGEGVEFRAPESVEEKVLAAIWGEVLGRDGVGLDDHFFGLGGHSLLAAQVLARLRRELGVEVPLRLLFERPVLVDLAAAVSTARAAVRLDDESAAPDPSPIETLPRDPDGGLASGAPLSFAQQRLWFLDQLEPGSAAYVLSWALRLRGPLDAQALGRAFDDLVSRHEVLRTRFVAAEDGEPVQIVDPPRPRALPVVDLTALGDAALGEARHRASAAATRPFELHRGPLLRTELLRLGHEDHGLLLSLHHIVGDGWSIGVILRELSELYDGHRRGAPVELPALTVQYADVAAWERRDVDERLEGQLAFWRRHLAAAPPVLELPTDRPRPAQQTFAGDRIQVELDRALVARLEARSRELGATPFMTLMAAWAVVLGRHAGQDAVVIGSPVAHRQRPELEGLVGLFANTLPLCTDLSGDPTFGELVERVRRDVLDGFAHQDLPFEKLVAELEIERDLAHAPVFQVMFALQNLGGLADRLGDLEVDGLDAEVRRSQFDLSLALQSQHAAEGVGLWGYLEFNTDLFDTATVEALLRRYRRFLEQVADHPHRPLSRVDLLDDAEQETVLRSWNRTAAAFDLETPIHRRIAATAADRPDAVAVAMEGDPATTYGELVETSRRLARHLAGLGVGPGSRVGVSMERRPEMVTALLAILETGAAYVPLDPSYPEDRLLYMRDDAAVNCILIHSGGVEQPPASLLAGAQVVDVAEPGPRGAAGALDVEIHPESLAYVLYTSGSTGRPKGVQIPHRALVNFLDSMALRPGLGPQDRLLSVTTLSFDIAGLELYLPLLVGARLELASRDTAFDPDALGALLERVGATAMQATPATWRLLVEGGWAGRPGLKALCGGEALAVGLAVGLNARGVQLWNLYGPTETTVWSTARPVPAGEESPFGGSVLPVGGPIHNTQVYTVDRGLRPVPVGVAGELVVGGDGLARGYRGRPGQTAERFVPDPFGTRPGSRLYRTGDLARRRADGDLEYLGRLDQQVKVRGFRIEPGEIEAVLLAAEEVAEAAVVVREDVPGDERLVAYVSPSSQPSDSLGSELRARAVEALPPYMVPAAVAVLDRLPLTPNGKVDRRALLALDPPATSAPVAAVGDGGRGLEPPRDDLERDLAAVWAQVLGLTDVGVDSNFFDLGGHSLLLPRVRMALADRFPQLTIVDLFRFPTVRRLAEHLRGDGAPAPDRRRARLDGSRKDSDAVAIIGMSGRFPGAADVDAFWRNVAGAVECITPYDEESLLAAGEDPERMARPDYVPYGADFVSAADFDPAFFGMTAAEAALTDPQHRLFLECCWEAMERAGWAGDPRAGAVGVYAGASFNTYLVNVLLTRPEVLDAHGGTQALISTDKDFVATRVAYKLDLTGPAVTVQTACSTSLVAVHMACRALVDGECDLALAGGATVRVPEGRGYVHVPDSIHSAEGRCRAFDRDADGTVVNSGVGVVVLKRLADAVADGDSITAVVRGSAMNNDGAAKVGFTAPSVDGQAAVVRDALARADVDPSTLGYVECHGTGTRLGDPIEVAALRSVWGEGAGPGTCALSSLKTQVGHLDIAAGVANLMRAALAVEHGLVPPNLHFREPNPELGLEGSPFFISAEPTPWPAAEGPRRAGVSAFGIGGTNAHVVLEEAPDRGPSGPGRPHVPIFLSARSESALDAMSASLADHLEANPELPLADVAFTLHRGRRRLPKRRALAAADVTEAAALLRGSQPRRLLDGEVPQAPPKVFFLFPGQGSQHAGMARGLYDAEPVFREELDACCDVLAGPLGLDLRTLLLAEGDAADEAQQRLTGTDLAQPALFVVQWALARLILHWGIEPHGMLGHSLGEIVAATLAGVFDRDRALHLVAARGRLMAAMPAGDMLAVTLPEAELRPRLVSGVDLATVNGPGDAVVSGPAAAVARMAEALAADSIETRPLHTSHAFHSAMMEPMLDVLRGEVELAAPRPPVRPFVSNVTGRWIGDEAADPEYWVRHVRSAVRFGEGLETLFEVDGAVFLEVGPGRTLTSLLRRHPEGRGRTSVPTLPHPREDRSAAEVVQEAVGALWLAGVEVDDGAFWGGEDRHRVVLPTYPFERRRCWVEPRAVAANPDGSVQGMDVADDGGGDGATAPEIPAGMSATEAKVASVWRELMGTDDIGPDDDFYDLGGHSLLATQVANRLRQVFGVELRANEILASALSVAEQAALIDGRLPETESEEPEGPAPVDGAPLSFAQERLWFLSQLGDAASTSYNLAFVGRFSGPLDVAALGRAWARLVERQGVLRASFVEIDGAPVQRLGDTFEKGLPVLDLEMPLGAGAEDDAIDEPVEAELGRRVAEPFDLARAPLWRMELLRAGAERHYLTFVIHHSIFDGWSWGILVGELAALYGEETGGPAAALPEIGMQYAEYAAWQRRRYEAGELEGEREYWRRQLQGAAPILELPWDRPRPATQSFEGDRVLFDAPAEHLQELHRLARAERTTLFAVLVASFQVLLHRLSGQRDVSVGTPVANRDRLELESTVGFFVNTAVLRTVMDPAWTFRRAVGEVAKVVDGAFAHQELPFEQIVDELRPERGGGHNPLFQVMFAYQGAGGGGLALGDARLDGLGMESRGSHFDLTLSVAELSGDGPDAGSLSGAVDFATDLFDRATVERFFAGYGALLAAVAEDPDRRISELPVMAPAELRRQLDTWNATAMAYPRSGARLHGLVLRQAASTPDLPAVADGSGEWTYAELEARSRRLAARLVDLGVGPGATVGLCLPGGRDAMAAVLGVLRVGGAYVPLDPETPPDRLLRLLNAARCTVLIAGDGTPAPYGYDGELLPIDGSWDGLPELAESVDAEVDVPPDAAAYVIFTSGSTGEPKGVVVSHRTVVNLTHGFVDRHGFTEGQRWLVIPPLHFDASVGDLFPALATGGCLVFHPDPGQLTGPTLEAFCETERIAVVDTAAALWKQWVDDWLALGRGDVLPDLDVMMVGGEAVDAERLRAWAGLTGGRVRFFNHYGPTEATVCATLFETRDASGVARSALPMGRPLGNVRVYVVGDDLRPVPTGAGGELVIGGAGVARGYLGEPAKTAEVFVPDPFAREGGARLYRTGDLVRWLPSGDLEFVGRRDRQVKIRGFRIELGEIEALLRRHDSARESVVLAREDLPGQKTLVAYVLRDPEHPADEGELRSYLRERLPAFMVPAALVILDVFPLTPNGKVDLRSLPAPSSSGPEAPAEPRTATEAEVLAVWRDVLGVPDLGVFQDFFELGGSSLLAMRLKIQVDRDLDLDVPLAKLFEATTVADYARVVEELRAGGGGELDLEAEAVLDEAIVPRPGAEPAEGVLLTGGTGFLGGFLLHEILTQMPGPVFVAVRAADVEAGLERIRANLETYGLPADPDRMARVRPVIGDLSKPLLGLGEAAFAELAAAVGQIFHNAASVNFVQPYGPLRPINVGGTEEVLRLAAHGGARPVHFVSTLGVFLTDDNGGRVVDEDRAPTPVGLEDGYNQSKWVAERLVEIARGRGLPANVFRPARVTGSADSGASNTGDLFYSWIKGCLQLGLAPDLDMPMDMLPVDYLAKAIVHLAAVTPAPGRAYHFYNPSTVPFRDLMAFAKGRGHTLDVVPYGRWVEALRAAVESGGDNALSAFLGLFPDEVEGDRQRPTFDQQRSQSLLAAAGLECPPVDTLLLDAYFGFLETVGFLPRPTPIEETR